MSAPFSRRSSADAFAMPDAPPAMTAFFPSISTLRSFLFDEPRRWAAGPRFLAGDCASPGASLYIDPIDLQRGAPTCTFASLPRPTGSR